MSDCNLLWCGKYTQHTNNETHNHDYFQMISIISGTGVLFVEENQINLEKGFVYLIHPKQEHSIITDTIDTSSEKLKVFDVKFIIDNNALFIDVCKLKMHQRIKSTQTVNTCFNRIINESTNKHEYYYSVICSLLQEILVYLVRINLKNNLEQTQILNLNLQEDTSLEDSDFMDKLVQYINYNYMHNITIEELTRYVGINRTTLINKFKQIFATTPMRYVNTIRLEKAKEFLENTNVSISDISALVGFQSIHYFSNFFKMHENITPAKYRTQHASSKYFSFENM